MDKQAKRDLKNVMVMALADGKLSQEEKNFIEQLRGKLAVEKSEFLELVRQVRDEGRKISLPRGGQAAEEAVKVLIEAAKADGVISPPEEKLLGRIAERVTSAAGQVEQALGGEVAEGNEDEVNTRIDEIYADFANWDAAARRKKLTELADLGGAAGLGLLHVLESYRAPDGLDNALELKLLVAEQIGRLGEDRAAYYLAQQVNVGDTDDDISNAALRYVVAEALGKIARMSFSRDQAGVEAARQWWLSPKSDSYDRLAF